MGLPYPRAEIQKALEGYRTLHDSTVHVCSLRQEYCFCSYGKDRGCSLAGYMYHVINFNEA